MLVADFVPAPDGYEYMTWKVRVPARRVTWSAVLSVPVTGVVRLVWPEFAACEEVPILMNFQTLADRPDDIRHVWRLPVLTTRLGTTRRSMTSGPFLPSRITSIVKYPFALISSEIV